MPTPFLENKVVVLAGAQSPLGKALLHRFSETGATIVAIYETIEQAYELFPPNVEGWVLAADLADENSVEACFQKIKVQFEAVNVLIHAAQVWDRKPIERTSLDQWQQVIRGNLDATFLTFREAIKLMPHFSGRLIALTNAQGVDKARSQHGAFAAAGAGVVRLVEAVAAEYAKMDIVAFAIATSILLTDEEGKHGVHAQDVAELCVSLCSPESKALNGATLRAYGTVQ